MRRRREDAGADTRLPGHSQAWQRRSVPAEMFLATFESRAAGIALTSPTPVVCLPCPGVSARP